MSRVSRLKYMRFLCSRSPVMLVGIHRLIAFSFLRRTATFVVRPCGCGRYVFEIPVRGRLFHDVAWSGRAIGRKVRGGSESQRVVLWWRRLWCCSSIVGADRRRFVQIHLGVYICQSLVCLPHMGRGCDEEFVPTLMRRYIGHGANMYSA
jgi:hypothetical protein